MKLKLLLLLLATSLFAQSGEQIFDTNCKSCHIMKKGWQLTAIDKQQLLGPTAFGVTKRIRDIFKTEKLFISFVDEYITNPKRIKSRCKDDVINKFGIMPATGKSMNKKEREIVARWMYKNL